MAKRPDLSSYQRKIVDRYYQHQDTIYATKLGELVGDIALAHAECLWADRAADAPARDAAEKSLTKLWKAAESYLAKCGADTLAVQRIVAPRDQKRLAEAAAAVMAGKRIPTFS
jgi:hypothetical protein